MPKERLAAFSDGVIAIIITIMVLELKVPHSAEWAALAALTPVFLSYVLSFVYLGIYWNNHHHLLHACERVNGAILWANLHLLFWLSLMPFATGWMGENHFARRAHGALRRGAADAGHRLLYAPARDRPAPGGGRAAGESARPRCQRQDLAGPLPRGDRHGVRPAVDLARHLCPCRPDVARPRPAHRARASRDVERPGARPDDRLRDEKLSAVIARRAKPDEAIQASFCGH